MRAESEKSRTNRTFRIITALKTAYPDSACSLKFKSVHQLMVATILSAQCTDERVNKVTPALFGKYRSVKAFADADINELQQLIYTTGFYVNKAKSIRLSAQQLMENHYGRMPRTLDELVKFVGVGRKTASVILGAGFGLAEGIVVDTHVGRISRLLDLTKEKEPVKVERDLMKIVPEEGWIIWTHLLIDHGRAVCVARRPNCADCTLARLCPSAIKKGK